MPYNGSDPSLQDLQKQITNLQAQITTNLTSLHTGLAGIQTQIKQVTLSLEGQLNVLKTAFAALQAYVASNIPS